MLFLSLAASMADCICVWVTSLRGTSCWTWAACQMLSISVGYKSGSEGAVHEPMRMSQ